MLSGQCIPEVLKLQILGSHISKHAHNGDAFAKLHNKAEEATHLIPRVSSHRAGMKEDGFIRLVQSFVVSHIKYIAPYLNWIALIRKAYKTALGLTETTSTVRLLQLGVHNTLEEREGTASFPTGTSLPPELDAISSRHLDTTPTIGTTHPQRH